MALHTEARMMTARFLEACDLAKCQGTDAATHEAFADASYWQTCVEQDLAVLAVNPTLYSMPYRKAVMSCFQLLRHATIASGTEVRLDALEDATRILKTSWRGNSGSRCASRRGRTLVTGLRGTFLAEHISLIIESSLPFQVTRFSFCIGRAWNVAVEDRFAED
eukprot:TRINITY_DN10437_c0_g1_i1.p1 TRINITY_DN10437_c0_g1~~TRINITY_DN10437_c0_g1_i1.p1  ORF type:complete len:188 (+),score=17.72 TRINITY_DN10437_c0_g1_i1:75-566(+)